MKLVKICPAHVGWLSDQIDAFWDEFGGWPLSVAKPTEDKILSWILSTEGVVALSGDKPAGFITWSILDNSPPYFGSKIMFITHWWVNKEHRNSRVGLALINHAKEVADAKLATHMSISTHVESGISDKAMYKLGFGLSNKIYTGITKWA